MGSCLGAYGVGGIGEGSTAGGPDDPQILCVARRYINTTGRPKDVRIVLLDYSDGMNKGSSLHYDTFLERSHSHTSGFTWIVACHSLASRANDGCLFCSCVIIIERDSTRDPTKDPAISAHCPLSMSHRPFKLYLMPVHVMESQEQHATCQSKAKVINAQTAHWPAKLPLIAIPNVPSVTGWLF